MPWGLMRGVIERRLADRLGMAVTIASLQRTGPPSLSPSLRLTGIRVAQPGWAGPGDFLAVRTAIVRLPLLPLLAGQVRIDRAAIDGLSLNLVHAADGQANWRRRAGTGSGGAPAEIVITDGRLTLRDAQRRMDLAATLRLDDAGLAIHGAGHHRGRPLTLAFDAAPVVERTPWRFRLALASPLVRLDADGRADRPLDLGRFTARLAARAVDARYLDDVIGAGLPGTQAIRLAATVRHDDRDWTLTGMTGAIGHSPLSGSLAVTRPGDRTRLDGALIFASLDFDDLASDEAHAAAAARRAVTGPRILPETPIHFEKLGGFDARVRLVAHRLVSRRPSQFRTLATTLTMDHRRLVLRPLRVGLRHGALTGEGVVDHRSGGPRLSLDLRLAGGRVEDILGGDDLTAPLAGRIRLSGTGRTVRAALGHASGTVALNAPGGSMDRRLAIIAGGDVLKALGAFIGGKEGRVPVRCLVADFRARDGLLSPTALVLDTPVARGDGGGMIELRRETITLHFSGRAKRPGPIQSTTPLRLIGTLTDPKISLDPPAARHKGTFARIGAFLKGLRLRGDAPQTSAAPDYPCPA